MLERSRITTKGRCCLIGGEDVPCLADVSATDVIELHRVVPRAALKNGIRVACYLDNIRLVDCVVMRGFPSDFALQVMANLERRSKTEARLTWLRSAETRNDQRAAARIAPVHRAVQIRLQGTEVTDAIIADLSMTGTVLLSETRPKVGALVTVGKRYATVVRHTAEGVGVAFRMPFGPLTFNEHVIL